MGVIGKVHFVFLTSEHTIGSKCFAHREIVATTGGPASTPLKQGAEIIGVNNLIRDHRIYG